MRFLKVTRNYVPLAYQAVISSLTNGADTTLRALSQGAVNRSLPKTRK